MSAWSDYQEEAARFFRRIGMEARTNVKIECVRTSHDIDVVVRSDHVGFSMLWIIECKLWKTPVSKLHVMGLREIVSDLGADRGILLSESGFQSGAKEAAELTNVQLTSLAELTESASYALGKALLRELQGRIEKCRVRYWNIDKEVRIDHGLRPPVGIPGFSARAFLEASQTALDFAFRDALPISMENLDAAAMFSIAGNAPMLAEVSNPADLAEKIEPHVKNIEKALDAAESAGREASN
jgi:restriction system protein